MTRPLGIDDLLRFAVRYNRGRILPSEEPEHYVWCRVHEQARKNTDRCMVPDYIGATKFIVAQNACITIAPFMSEWEAERLRDGTVGDGRDEKPLGMTIE